MIKRKNKNTGEENGAEGLFESTVSEGFLSLIKCCYETQG